MPAHSALSSIILYNKTRCFLMLLCWLRVCFVCALCPQFVQFLAFFTLFVAYMAVAVYGNSPDWSTSDLLAHPQGRAALALECILMVMMFGQAADEAKQMVTYKQDYFNSPWNYFDCASIVIITTLFLLHITRLNHQVWGCLLLFGGVGGGGGGWCLAWWQRISVASCTTTLAGDCMGAMHEGCKVLLDCQKHCCSHV